MPRWPCEEVLTLKQAGERIGLSAETLYKQVRNGALKATSLGGRWLVTASDLDEYERDHKGKRGFANPSHPHHGTQAGGGRRKKPR
jgi:excisionase family DNA binding protein